jgi:glycosyltransferase involved in cell wall biosynthesis
MLESITPIVITRDEEPNIARVLERLTWAKEVLVCDSGSTDRTLEIARSFPNVRILERPLDTLANQWNFAIAEARTPWVLTLDADYIVPKEVVEEMASLTPADDASGYESAFLYAMNGRPLRATLYPPRTALLRRDRVSFYMGGHAQRVTVEGRILPLREKLVHDDRKGIRRFFARQRRYMRQEAAMLREANPRTLNRPARIRRLRVVAPLVIVPYVLFVKGLILDGVPGLHYALERLVAECVLSWELIFGKR